MHKSHAIIQGQISKSLDLQSMYQMQKSIFKCTASVLCVAVIDIRLAAYSVSIARDGT